MDDNMRASHSDLEISPEAYLRLDHQYQTLPDSRRFVRLLRVAPYTTPTSAVRITLHTAELHAVKLGFGALSYTWGSNGKDALVEVDDGSGTIGTLKIGTNLHAFLDMFRRLPEMSLRSVPLWIDQVCVNQNDTAERSAQVSIMRDIYTLAAGVIAWLGPAFDDSDLLIKDIRDSGDRSRGSMWSRLLELPIDEAHTIRRQQLIPMLQTLRNFTMLPYWSRLWICQELILGRKVTVFVGDDYFDWDDHFHFEDRKWLGFTSSIFNDIIPHEGRLGSLSFQRAIYASNGGASYTWADALLASRGTHCSDQQDRIYGLTGLVNWPIMSGVDYSKNMRSIFFDAMHDHLSLSKRNFRDISGLKTVDTAKMVQDWHEELQLQDLIAQHELVKFIRNEIFDHRYPKWKLIRFLKPQYYILWYLVRTKQWMWLG